MSVRSLNILRENHEEQVVFFAESHIDEYIKLVVPDKDGWAHVPSRSILRGEGAV